MDEVDEFLAWLKELNDKAEALLAEGRDWDTVQQLLGVEEKEEWD
jgi:hypothetical protein